MFTKNDLISYLSDLETLENNMFTLYMSTADQIDDPKVKKILSDLANVEKQHKKLVDQLRTLIIKESITED
ncbi:MAG: hypothetical protein WCQ47_07180 [bacterium]